jgi:Domain of unknown function (DUF4136)
MKKQAPTMKCLGIPYLGVAILLFAIGLGAAAQKVTITDSKDFDFKNHRRYAWRPNHILTRQGHQNDQIIEQKIVRDVNQLLTAKGFIEDPSNPDFFVSCDAGAVQANTDVEAPPPEMSALAPLNMYPGVRQNIWYSVDGEITFSLVDSKSNQAVWTAVATKKIRDPKKAMKDLDQQVQQFVSKAFNSFPPRAK